MLKWLKGRASNRKLRLFMVALLRIEFAGTKSLPEWARRSVDEAEAMADGNWQRTPKDKKLLQTGDNAHYGAVCIAKIATERRGKAHVSRQTQSDILREIFGNPFRPRPVTLDPRWLSSTVIDLATMIYEQRAFEQMPILADALMDAGCNEPEVLDHCRSNQQHVRGCWVVDSILGKS